MRHRIAYRYADVDTWAKQVTRDFNYGEPLFTMAYTLGTSAASVSGRTRIPAEILTLAAARMGAIAGPSMNTPLLARTAEATS